MLSAGVPATGFHGNMVSRRVTQLAFHVTPLNIMKGDLLYIYIIYLNKIYDVMQKKCVCFVTCAVPSSLLVVVCMCMKLNFSELCHITGHATIL